MLKIVGDACGELYIEYNGQKIAKVLDEYTCKDLFGRDFKTIAQKEDELDEKLDDLKDKIKEYLNDNIEDYIDWYSIKKEIVNAAEDCIDDFR